MPRAVSRHRTKDHTFARGTLRHACAVTRYESEQEFNQESWAQGPPARTAKTGKLKVHSPLQAFASGESSRRFDAHYPAAFGGRSAPIWSRTSHWAKDRRAPQNPASRVRVQGRGGSNSPAPRRSLVGDSQAGQPGAGHPEYLDGQDCPAPARLAVRRGNGVRERSRSQEVRGRAGPRGMAEDVLPD